MSRDPHLADTTRSGAWARRAALALALIALIAIPGTANANPASPSSIDFGDVPINTTAMRTMTQTIDAGYSWAGADFDDILHFGFGLEPCGAGPSTCSFPVFFTPSSVGPLSGTMTLGECVVGEPTCLLTSVPLTGTGISVLAVTPSSVDFQDVPLTSSSLRTLAVTLDSGYHFSSFSASNTGLGFSADPYTCATSTSDTCAVRVRFAPPSLGPASETLTLHECNVDNSRCLTVDVPMTGTGIPPLVVTTSSLPDGTVGTPYAATLQADGGTPPYFWFPETYPPGLSFDRLTGTISGTPTASGLFEIQAEVGDHSTPTQIGSKIVSVAIIGHADLAVSLAAAPKPVAYPKPVTITITIQNHGPDAAQASLANVLPAGSQFVSSTQSQGSCSAPPVGLTGAMTCSVGALATGATATVTVVVKPTIRRGTITDTATVSPGAYTTDSVSADDNATVAIQVK